MTGKFDVEDLILNYDPEFPQARFIAAGLEGALRSSTGRLPSAVPWPEHAKPQPVSLDPEPKPTDDLRRFKGYDAVVVTWTAAEAAALAALLTPDYLPSRWYEYKHGVDAYIPLVTGPRAPFNDKSADMARYYRSLALYFPCTIGDAKVLLMKSGLHLDYDGPAIPVRKLIAEIASVVQPKLFITTGTGGGIGADVALGDVVIAGRVRFDCATQFKNQTWRNNSYDTSPCPPSALSAITPALTKVNASRIVGARPIPQMWASPGDTIVTTDFFGFDDSTDYYHLQGGGARACDMGDAMIGDALSAFPDIRWHAIRNASDPQMPNLTGDIEAAKRQAGEIYAKYGAFTTAASVIATWAIIDASCNGGETDMDERMSKRKGKAIHRPAHHVARRGGDAHDPLQQLSIRTASPHGGYGWMRDLPDARDFMYAAPLMRFPKGLPQSVDLRPECPPVYDQGQLGSCTANGIAAAIQFDQAKQGTKQFTPSRLFIYYCERVIEGTVGQDSGAQIRDGIKVVATIGAPPETDWQYDIKEFAVQPPALAYADAKLDLVSSYSRVAQNLAQMQGCLAEGYPFVFGFTVYESFESPEVAKTGIVPMPTSGESVVGGHCVMAVGYDATNRMFIIRNSWSAAWGIKGYCMMPFEYLLTPSLANDFWTIRSVTG